MSKVIINKCARKAYRKANKLLGKARTKNHSKLWDKIYLDCLNDHYSNNLNGRRK